MQCLSYIMHAHLTRLLALAVTVEPVFFAVENLYFRNFGVHLISRMTCSAVLKFSKSLLHMKYYCSRQYQEQRVDDEASYTSGPRGYGPKIRHAKNLVDTNFYGFYFRNFVHLRN